MPTTPYLNGTPVRLINETYKTSIAGELVLPDVKLYGPNTATLTRQQKTSGAYGVYTIRREDGTLYRNEGILQHL